MNQTNKSDQSTNSEERFCNSTISDLQEYMFFKHLIDDALEFAGKRTTPSREGTMSFQEKAKEQKQPYDKLVESALFKPYQKDSLFWCFYILSNGIAAYETIGTNHFLIEKNEKIKLVELLRSKKHILKQHKLSSLSTIEHDLTNNVTITVPTFAAICIANEINVLYVNETNNTYFEITNNEIEKEEKEEKHGKETEKNNNTNNVLYKTASSMRFACACGILSSRLCNVYENYYKLFTIEKPLRPISSFKISELLELGVKMKVMDASSGVKPAKKDLYEALVTKLA